MTALVKVVCGAWTANKQCDRKIGVMVADGEGYALDYTLRFDDEDERLIVAGLERAQAQGDETAVDSILARLERMKPKRIRHNFAAEPGVWTICPSCDVRVYLTLDDGDIRRTSLREKAELARRTGKLARHAVGRGFDPRRREG